MIRTAISGQSFSSDLRSGIGRGVSRAILQTVMRAKAPFAYHYADPDIIDDGSKLLG